MRRVILLTTLIFSFLPLLSYSATTGKISGIVTDSQTGEPLPGANVIMEGTLLGASTDFEGYYTIINIPPGIYTLKVSYIGYNDKVIENVRVHVDRTTTINITLTAKLLESEAITVVAKREQIRKDVSSSVANIAMEDVESLPVLNMTSIIGLQAGIERGITIRGGGIEQSDFLVDGLSMKDDRTNTPLTTALPLSAIQEMVVQTGGFNAEYGQVRSGIINTVIKDGSTSEYSGSITINYSPPAPKHFGISPFDRNSFWLRPYFDDAVCWTGTENGVWDEYTQRQYPRFVGWNEISRRTYENDDPTDDLSPSAAQRIFAWQHRRDGTIDKPDYNIDIGFGGPVPIISKKTGNLRFYAAYRNFNSQYLVPLSRSGFSNQNFLLKLSSNIASNMKLSLTGMYGNTLGTASNTESGTQLFTDIWNVAAGVSDGYFKETRIFSDAFFSAAEKDYSLFSLKLTHTLSTNSFYEASLKYTSNKYLTEPLYLRDTSRVHEVFPGYFLDEAPFGYIDNSVDGMAGFHMGGHIGEARDFSRVSTASGKIDFTSQWGRHHLLKTGLEFQYTDLNLDYGGHNSQFPGNVSWNSIQEIPLRGAFYLQDKIEYEGFIANVGLRVDYHNPNTKWPDVDPYDKDFYSDKYNDDLQVNKKEINPQFTFSPRLGIAHPIGENAKLYFNYGHFRQLPSAEGIYELRRTGFNQLISIGDPSLTLEKTVAYELGYEQSFSDLFVVQLAGYYKDISAQRSYVHYVDISEKVNYWKEENNNYQDIRGFELTLRRNTGRWVSGFANYTYMVYTSGYFGVEEHFENPADQRDYLAKNPYQEKPLPQPYARVNLNLHTPGDFGGKWLGVNWLSDWRFSFLYYWRSGEWDTWNPNDRPGLQYNIRWKDYHNVNLRITKLIRFKHFDLSLIADITNLFNFKEFSQYGFYDAQDRYFYLRSLHLPADISENIGSVYIPGDDQPGDSRKPGVPFQPINPVGSINAITSPKDGLIYYDMSTKKYMEYSASGWAEVDAARMQKILEDKAYIDMPNQSSFTFLNPRDIFFGIKISFHF